MEEYKEVYLHLFDYYTKRQLVEIAKHNNVPYRLADKKLNIAKAIATSTEGEYSIPTTLTPTNKVPESRVQSLSGKKRGDYLRDKADRVDEQWRNVLSEEEFAEKPLVNKDRRRNNNTPVDPEEKIAVYSNRNISWKEVGTLSKGYSFITRREAESWTRLRGVRVASPEEVASHFDIV